MGVILVTNRMNKENETLNLFGLGVVKFVILLILLLAVNNPLKDYNHTSAILFCLNYFVFQAGLIAYIHHKHKSSKENES